MTALRLLAVTLLCQGCLANPDTFEAGHGFNGWRAEVFEQAARDWCQGADLCAELGNGGASEVRVGELSKNYNGCADNDADGGTTITVREDLDAELLYYILLHELGHHWYCTDVDDKSAAMHYSDGGNARRLSIYDMDCGS